VKLESLLRFPITPGPWRQCAGAGATEIRGEPTPDLAAQGITSPRVCRILRSDPQQHANAKVIAKVPELLQIALWAEVTLIYAANAAQHNGQKESARMFDDRLAEVRLVLREMQPGS
jgi:hypothetical protein